MPTRIDRNASSNDRIRRNFQRMTQGALTSTINVTSPITNGTSGLGLAIDPAGAISTGAAGIGVKVDGSTVTITGDKLHAVSSPSVLLAADASILVGSSTGSTTVRVQELSTGGISTGLTGIGIKLAGGSGLTLSSTGLAVGILTSTNLPSTLAYLNTAGLFVVTHLLSSTATPGIATGAGAGSSPTIAIAGTDTAGTITLTAGTLPSINAIICTVTFAIVFAAIPRVLFSAGSSASALGAAVVYSAATVSTFTLNSDTTALTVGASYVWNYHVIG